MPLDVLQSPAEWLARYGAASASHKRSALTIGCFDGIHLGHQHVLKRVAAKARETWICCPASSRSIRIRCAFCALRKRRCSSPRSSSGWTDSRRLGVAAALVLKFDAELARISAEEFLRGILVEQLGMAAIFVGPHFRFGHQQRGNVEMLEAGAGRYDYAVELLLPVQLDGGIVSSTAIRSAVAEGRVREAARLLGRPFSLTGAIRAGAGRGRTILFPTLNLSPEQELLPKTGVYVTETQHRQACLRLGDQRRRAPDRGWR